MRPVHTELEDVHAGKVVGAAPVRRGGRPAVTIGRNLVNLTSGLTVSTWNVLVAAPA